MEALLDAYYNLFALIILEKFAVTWEELVGTLHFIRALKN